MNRNVTPSTTGSSQQNRTENGTELRHNRIEIDGMPYAPFWPDRPCVGLCAVEWLAHMAVAGQEDDDA